MLDSFAAVTCRYFTNYFIHRIPFSAVRMFTGPILGEVFMVRIERLIALLLFGVSINKIFVHLQNLSFFHIVKFKLFADVL